MARERSDLWETEIVRAADGAEIPAEVLATFFRTHAVVGTLEPWGEPEILKALGRLLVLSAEELEGGSLEAARGGLLGLAQVASLLEVPRLSEWAIRLAESPEIQDLAPDAASMLRGEAFEMVFTQSLMELRECQWRWPERRVIETPAPVVVAEAVVVAEPEIVAIEEPVQVPEPKLEPEPEPEPAPPVSRPKAPVVRRAPERALVADPSAIAAGFLARLLMSRGVAVTMAESAERAAAEVARGGYDVAFVGAEWPAPAHAGETLIVRLYAEGSAAQARPGERVLFKPPAEEEVRQILEAWSGRSRARLP